MAEKKERRPTYTTPKGEAGFCALTEPNTKYKDGGEYSAALILDGASSAELMQMLADEYAAAEKAGREEWNKLDAPAKKRNPFKMNPYYREELDREGNETGRYCFTFRCPASYKDEITGKVHQKSIALFDRKAQAIKEGIKIYGGSILKISFYVKPYFVAATGCGISLRLVAAQVLKLSEYGGRSASSYGFAAEDGEDESAEASFCSEGGGNEADF